SPRGPGKSWRRGAPFTLRFFSDRKLKKATNANCVRHWESSIKTITRKNFGPDTHLTYSAAGKQRASRWIRPRSSRPTCNTRALVESDQRRHVNPQTGRQGVSYALSFPVPECQLDCGAVSARLLRERNPRIRSRILPPRCHWVHARMQF